MAVHRIDANAETILQRLARAATAISSTCCGRAAPDVLQTVRQKACSMLRLSNSCFSCAVLIAA